MKDLNFLAGKDITWIENNFEPIPKGYILGKDDVICDMSKMRTAKENNNRFAFFTNLSPYDKNANWTTTRIYKGYVRYNYDIYDVKFDKNGKIIGSFRENPAPTANYPVFHSRYEYTLYHRNFYMFKQSIPEFMNWPNKIIEGL